MVLAMREGRITEARLIELMATDAQRLFGLQLPHDTYTVVDTDASWVVTDRELRCSPGWSPFAGTRVWGRVDPAQRPDGHPCAHGVADAPG